MNGVTSDRDQARLDYRAFMACQAGDGWTVDASAQLACWLREKDFDVNVEQDGTYESPGARLVLRHHQNGTSQSFRAQLVEQTRAGIWTTDLTAHDRRGAGDWLTLSVTSDSARFVAVPRLARYLVKTLPLTDGLIEFVDEPRLVSRSTLDELIDVLCDEERHGLVFVAGTSADCADIDAYVTQVGRWAREVYGLAQVIVLDPTATKELIEAFGRDHAVQPGTLRTFLPGVDPASLVDGRRHRFLSQGRIADMSEAAIVRLLGGIARGQASARLLSAEVSRVRRTFDRIENRAIVAAIEPASVQSTPSAISLKPLTGTPPLEARDDSASNRLDLVKAVLGITVVDEASLQRIVDLALAPRAEPDSLARASARIDGLQAEKEALEDQLRLAQSLRDDGEEERAELEEELTRAQAEARWLRSRSADSQDYEGAYGVMPTEWLTDYPSSFDELLARIDDGLTAVQFTGDVDLARGVDDHDSLQVAVRNAWDVCLALQDYATARASGTCQHGMDHYLKHTPDGCRGVPPRKHAPTETAQTMQQFGDKRVFKVPPNVAEGGRVIMTAHFRLAQIGMVSPRLYYLDDALGSGKVYIGYIGPHLPNTQTN